MMRGYALVTKHYTAGPVHLPACGLEAAEDAVAAALADRRDRPECVTVARYTGDGVTVETRWPEESWVVVE